MIFGVDAPKFVFDPGGENEAQIMLDYVVIQRDEPERDLIEHKSVLNGHRQFYLKGKHWVYEVRMHLYKYADPRAKYEEVKQYEGLDVWLYRHREGQPFKDKDGTEVLFTITGIDEVYLDTPDYKDILIITFQSKDYVNLSDGSIVPEVLAEDVIIEGGASV